KVYGHVQQSRCFCYVNDTVEALVRLQNCPAARGNIFNIGSTEEISILNLARLVLETMNSSAAIELVPYSEAYEPGFEDMRRRKPVVEKLARTIQFQPATSLRDIILRTARSGS